MLCIEMLEKAYLYGYLLVPARVNTPECGPISRLFRRYIVPSLAYRLY
jgi:hypothetical protein